MSGNAPVPTEIKLRQASRLLELRYEDGTCFQLPYELLRVFSPSAEVRGHGPGQEVLQTGKEDVTIQSLRQVGNYAVAPSFSDGHDSGIYTWEWLYHLGQQQDALWREYLERLELAGIPRRAD
jgi:DUF971 family protein